MKSLISMDDVLSDEMALVFGGSSLETVPVVNCNQNGIVNIPTNPNAASVNLF